MLVYLTKSNCVGSGRRIWTSRVSTTRCCPMPSVCVWSARSCGASIWATSRSKYHILDYTPVLYNKHTSTVYVTTIRIDASVPFVFARVQVNHRRLLDAYLGACGVPLSGVRAVCSSIDKLDKTPWQEVRDELVLIKEQSPEVVDRIAQYVKLAG